MRRVAHAWKRLLSLRIPPHKLVLLHQQLPILAPACTSILNILAANRWTDLTKHQLQEILGAWNSSRSRDMQPSNRRVAHAWKRLLSHVHVYRYVHACVLLQKYAHVHMIVHADAFVCTCEYAYVRATMYVSVWVHRHTNIHVNIDTSFHLWLMCVNPCTCLCIFICT